MRERGAEPRDHLSCAAAISSLLTWPRRRQTDKPFSTATLL